MNNSRITKERRSTGKPFSKREQVWGFTLMEVLVVVGILAIVGSFALGVGIDTLLRSRAQTESELVVHLLQKARARAMNNMWGSKHKFEVASSTYILSYTNASTSVDVDEETPIGGGVNLTGDTEVTFNQLTGEVEGGSNKQIRAEGEAATYIIDISPNGRINWTKE